MNNRPGRLARIHRRAIAGKRRLHRVPDDSMISSDRWIRRISPGFFTFNIHPPPTDPDFLVSVMCPGQRGICQRVCRVPFSSPREAFGNDGVTPSRLPRSCTLGGVDRSRDVAGRIQPCSLVASVQLSRLGPHRRARSPGTLSVRRESPGIVVLLHTARRRSMRWCVSRTLLSDIASACSRLGSLAAIAWFPTSAIRLASRWADPE
jgi:hypothetical protein